MQIFTVSTTLNPNIRPELASIHVNRRGALTAVCLDFWEGCSFWKQCSLCCLLLKIFSRLCLPLVNHVLIQNILSILIFILLDLNFITKTYLCLSFRAKIVFYTASWHACRTSKGCRGRLQMVPWSGGGFLSPPGPWPLFNHRIILALIAVTSLIYSVSPYQQTQCFDHVILYLKDNILGEKTKIQLRLKKKTLLWLFHRQSQLMVTQGKSSPLFSANHTMFPFNRESQFIDIWGKNKKKLACMYLYPWLTGRRWRKWRKVRKTGDILSY